MTDEQIIEMAKKSGIPIANVPNLAFGRLESGVELLKTFAKLVAQHEREACIEIAEKQRYAMLISLTSHPAQNGTAVGIANQIRARGKA